eukprot:scaffold98373_cov75-Phaeocystis_antarctica.AAC.7
MVLQRTWRLRACEDRSKEVWCETRGGKCGCKCGGGAGPITPVLAIGGDGEGRRRGELPNGGPTTA